MRKRKKKPQWCTAHNHLNRARSHGRARNSVFRDIHSRSTSSTSNSPRESNADGGGSPFGRAFGSARRLFGRASSNLSAARITPDSSAESQEPPVGSIRKKVEWGEVTDHNVQNISVPGNQIFSQPELVRSLPPSAERKARKSILKANVYNGSSDASGILSRSDTTISYATKFAIMLESTTQQLAGTDRSAKVDAYLTLSESLRASDNVPDLQELRNKMDLILSFVKRDLTEKAEENKPELSLAINALVFLGSLFHSTSVAEIIPSDFALYIIEHCIKTFEDPLSSKDVARHLMFILAKQNFPTKVMNQDRVGKLVKALHNIESGNLTGKRIIDGRINIYRTLIRQSRSYMLSNHLWIQDLFTDMTSNLKEIRTNAITLGLEAGFTFGMDVKITRAVCSLFETEVEEKGKYGHVLISRLKEMLQKKDEKDATSAAAVPQIWSVVVLFFQGRIRLLMQWEFLADWLKLISDTFNQSDVAARKEALVAWNKFIFVVYSNEQNSASSSNSSLLKMLPQALQRQLRRENLRAQSLNTLCCLLHYSMKSATTQTQQDASWNEHVVALVGNGLIPADVSTNPKKARAALTDACSVLQGLFDHTTTRTYNENRILDNNFSVKELPPVDPKWLRKSAPIVFPLLSSLLEKMFWELGDISEITLLWRTYIKSIASPAAKEITVSMDTMTSVACIFGFLHRIWNLGPEGLHILVRPTNNTSDSTAFLNSFEQLVTTLLNGIGPLPFTDRQLSSGSSDTFLPVATPSRRPPKIRGQIKSPFHHLFNLLITPSPNLEYDQSFARLVRRILSPFYECRKTKRAQIELSKGLIELLPAGITESCRIIWQVIATFTASIVDTRETDNSDPRDQPLGARYKDLVKILEFGIGLAQHEPLPGWKSLFDATICSATLDAGDAGKAIAVIEPLAAVLLAKDSPIHPLARLLHFNLIVGKASYPKDKQALDVAGKKLWGAVPNGQRGASFDPFAHLYELCQASLESSYASFEAIELHNYVDMLNGTVALVTRCPPVLYYGLLTSIQIGVSIWVHNSESKFSGGDKLSVPVLAMMNKSWEILAQLQNSIDHSRLLFEFETILCSGLESKQKNVVNTTIKFWNASFGQSEQALEYPGKLKEILLRLRAITEIELPSLPASLISALDARQPMDFEESQFDAGSMFNGSALSSVLRLRNTSNHLLSSPSRRLKEATPQVLLSQSSLKRARDETPDLKSRKSRKRQSTPKLRHDDSQLQFQPIDSSPIADRVADSQILTDRQKEVKERQQLDAGIFHSISSSPRRREKSVEEADPELPLPRSSSLLRSVSRERRPTPTLVTPSDDDRFVASSPTPTRSLRGEVTEDGPPSSPPDSARDVVMDFDDDIPSSPPEQADEPEANLSTSSEAFAQIDSALQDVKSTYGSTADFDSLMTSVQPGSRRDVEIQPSTKTLINKAVRSQRSKSRRIHDLNDEIEETIIGSPSTPKKQMKKTPTTTPKTPRDKFVDARGSPISSDKPEGEDDVFEDAISSPKLQPEQEIDKVVSSALSNLDESSILRALAEADNAVLAVPSSSKKETPNTRKSTRSLSAQRSRKASQLRKDEIGTSSSSFPSHIPETPAPTLVALPISAKIMLGNQALSPEETIFVDDSELYEEFDAPRKGGKKLKQKVFVTHSRKRKSTEDLEVGNSQQETQTSQTSKASHTSEKKRGRGRPRKYPRASSSQGSVREQSMLSIASAEEEEEVKPSPAELEDMEMEIQGTDEVITNAQADIIVPDPSSDVEEDSRNFSITNLKSKNKPKFQEEEEQEEADDDDESEEEIEIESTPSPTQSQEEEEISQQIIEETRLMSQSQEEQTPVPAVAVPTASVVVEVQKKAPLSTAQTVTELLKQAMEALEAGKISRNEVGVLEDLLMDTKELLYGAARRGRGGR